VLGDIDFFKRVNDSYGHAFGDRVLRAVAQTLKSVAAQTTAQTGSAEMPGPAAIAARVGGEEFAMLLPSGHLQQAQSMAEAMRSSVAASRIRRGDTALRTAQQPTPDGEQDINRVTISLGVTQMSAGESAEAFFKRADRALYASKHTGRNCVTVLAAA
jgi:diguanylate cyclase